MSHIPRVKTLTNITYDTLQAGETLDPEMYKGIFPLQESMLEGFEATYDTLIAAKDEAHHPGTKTERLIELFRQTNLIGQHVHGPYVAITTATYVPEANEILRKDEQLDTTGANLESHPNLLYTQKVLDAADHNDMFPPEYYTTVNAGTILHQRTTTYEHLSPSILAMRNVCSALSYYYLGGHVAMDILDGLKQRLGESAEYYAERNRLPYKRLTYSAMKNGDELKQGALEAIASFKSPSDEAVSSGVPRAGNYDAAGRIICGSYARLRQRGYGQQDSIGALYANGKQFRAFIKAVADAQPYGLPNPTAECDHSFRQVIESPLIIEEDSDGIPRFAFSLQDAYEGALMPDIMPDHIVRAFARKRMSGGLCPARHTVSGSDGAGTEHIASFSADIATKYGVDPGIVTSEKRISIASLHMAMAIRMSERYGLFDALDMRLAKEDVL